MTPLSRLETFVDTLQDRAVTNPDAGYRFLDEGEHEGASLSLAELNRRARAIGATLAAKGAAGKRVLLLYVQGLDLIEALFGAMYAGAIPVPAYPPDPARLGRTLPRLLAVIRDADVEFALTTAALRDLASGMAEQTPEFARVEWLASDAIPSDAAGDWRRPALVGSDLALLQYTSGSTGTPRGVSLTHANLLHQVDAFWARAGSQKNLMNWVPFYHDLGLIAAIIGTVGGGHRTWMMSPLDFLTKPIRWLSAMSRFRTQASAAPNFAFDLCTRRISDAELEGLDLSSLEVLGVGAEPVSAATLDAFLSRFSRVGLPRTALAPCYGLAETTLAVSLEAQRGAYRVLQVDSAAIEAGRIVHKPQGAGARALVSCGQPLEGMDVRIVHPVQGTPTAPNEVGEIWVGGASVAKGYWAREEESTERFQARLPNGDGPFYRTGDLGFLYEGDIFITGRIKDLIIVRGRNLYPQDIERTVGAAHPAIRQGCAAAFALSGDATEQVGVVVEVNPERIGSPSAVFDAIRSAVALEHEVAVHRIALIAPRTMLKTSSGKIQRRASRDALVAGELELIAEDTIQEAKEKAAPVSARNEPVRRLIAEVLGIATEQLSISRPLVALGLDSLRAATLAERLQRELSAEISPATLLGGASLEDIAALVEHGSPKDALPPIAPVPRSGEGPLSFTEAALFRWVEMEPRSPSHNLFVAVQLNGEIDDALLERSFRQLIARQESLRTRFVRVDERTRRRVETNVEWSLLRRDLRSAPEHERAQALRQRAAEVQLLPIDATVAPLMIAELVRTGEREAVVFLLLSHLISDGWSFGVMLRELASIHEALRRGAPAVLPALPIQSLDFATWEQSIIDPAALGAELEKARQMLVPLQFPLDRPHAERLDKDGSRLTISTGADLRGRLTRLCEKEGVPLMAAIVTAFQLMLRDRTGQDTISFNLVHSDRQRLGLRDVIGFFAYALIHQEEVGALVNDPLTLMRRNQQRIVRTEYADRLRMVLRTPSNRVALNFHNYPVTFEGGGLAMKLRPDLLQSIYLWDAHDLMLDLRDSGDELSGDIFYRGAVLDESTVAALRERFVAALERLCGAGA